MHDEVFHTRLSCRKISLAYPCFKQPEQTTLPLLEVGTPDIYCSFVKEHPWAEHLTSMPKRGVGALLNATTFNHEEASMYAYNDSLPTNLLKYCTNNNVQWNHGPWKLTFLTAHNTVNGKMPP